MTWSGPQAGERTGLPVEIVAVWLLFAVVTTEILVTYSRIPAGKLYHVSGSGLEGGASRALVFWNFPLALVAIPILALLAALLPGRAVKAVAAVGAVLAAAVYWPGVVSQSDLDARPVNAIAAAGVLVAVALTVYAAVRLGPPRPPERRPGDPTRIVVAAVALVLALPWMGADLGFYLDGVPLLGRLYQTGKVIGLPGEAPLPTVHHGHHHGMDGTLLVLAALLLSRLLPVLARGWARGLVAAYLAVMLCYGAANIANDDWIEQVVKRGWTGWQIPNVLEPRATVAWGVILLASAAVWALAYLRPARRIT